jgi:hypothetical protein
MGTQRQACSNAARRTVQPALQLGVAVSYAEHWAGCGKATMELLALCTVLSMLLHWTDCDLCTGTGSQAQSTGREMLQAGSKAISHALSAVYQLCCALCVELTK